jgi:hypothetical protein
MAMSHINDREGKNPMSIHRTAKKYDCVCIDLSNLKKRSQRRRNNGWKAWCRLVIQGLKKRYILFQAFVMATFVTPVSAGDSIRDYFVWIFGLIVFVIAAVQSYFT